LGRHDAFKHFNSRITHFWSDLTARLCRLPKQESAKGKDSTMKLPKFIITMDGTFRLGMIDFDSIWRTHLKPKCCRHPAKRVSAAFVLRLNKPNLELRSSLLKLGRLSKLIYARKNATLCRFT
jgi:hypothetical protein